MPIKWSAVKVSEAMDEVESQVNLADAFLADAKAKAAAAGKIADLPEYIEQRINRLVYQLGRIEGVKSAIESVRQEIPGGAIEAERERLNKGNQQPLI